jgi:hypothetical protein
MQQQLLLELQQRKIRQRRLGLEEEQEMMLLQEAVS